MFPRLGYTIHLLLLLALSGCFQQASESFEPASSTIEPLNVPNSVDGGQEESEITALPSTPTFPPITIISQPTLSNLGQATSEPLDKPEETLDAMDASAGQPDTPLFITPGLPAGPINFGTPAATAPGGAPTATPSGLVTPTDLFAGQNTECTYIVASGDNLYRIAVTNNTTVEAMKQANPDLVGEAPILQPGQVLNLPGCEASSAAPASNTTTQGVPDSSVPQPGATSAPSNSGQTYTVKAGDTLFSIATVLGTTVQAIVDANNLTNPDSLQVGQQLIIP